jgi:acetyl/propionyl-CoA carboxylase alpha subunit
MLSFRKVLVANRGEIASRIIKAAQGLGIIAVAIYAQDDRNSLHVSQADEAISLGDGNISETYLNIPKIIEIAVATKCSAIHPGYGFLSENHLLAKNCKDNDIVFIGPTAKAIKQMGDKTEARNIVKALGIPVLAGYEGTVEELQARKDLKFPLIVKPSMGGGGKGMHIVQNQQELKEKVDAASREAGNYFANKRVYLEQYIEFARHIEVQIAGDHFGNVIHLNERECTIQRNFQKIIEEAPSPSINADLRKELTSAAVKIAKAVNYTNAGTLEFLLDDKGNWYFIEMNTRIQVEHPVTEAITGIDLVKLQVQIAQGNPLPYKQEDIAINGHAIEMRINAEDPVHHFRPSSGTITHFVYPDTCRFDTFIASPYQLTSHYDSLLGKLIVYDINRNAASLQAIQGLNDTHIHGIETNIPFLKSILSSDEFSENNLYTRWCNHIIPSFIDETISLQADTQIHIPLIAFVYLNFQKAASDAASIWQSIGYWRTIQQVNVKHRSEIYDISFHKTATSWFYKISGNDYEVKIIDKNQGYITINSEESFSRIYFSFAPEGKTCIEFNGFRYMLESPDLLQTAMLQKKKNEASDGPVDGHIRSPLHGRVTKINVLENTKINRGDVLLVIESMKTENHIVAPMSGLIKTIHVSEGNQVKDNALLIELEYFNI